MDTLHKRLSEIRDLRAEEFDLVGGADEGTGGNIGTATYYPSIFNTTSMVYANGSSYHSTDDGVFQGMVRDNS
jgi:hypothetical protein